MSSRRMEVRDISAFGIQESADSKRLNNKQLAVVTKTYENINHGRRREDNSIRVALIDDRPLTRESVSHFLSASGHEFTICTFSDVDELLESCTGDPEAADGVVVLCIGWKKVEDEPVRGYIERLRQAFPDTPVVVLSDREDLSCISQAFRLGIRGYIATTLEAAIVREAIRLVRAGGTFLPCKLLASVQEQLDAIKEVSSSEPLKVHEDTIENLTPRELDVLHALRQGKSNKAIAYELQMRECTVKVHIRHIMTKLKATNRTQAALIANQIYTSGTQTVRV